MHARENRKIVPFVKTVAKIDGNVVTINTSKNNLGWGYEGQERLPKPWWTVVSTAFIFETPEGPCVTLVKREGKTRHSGKWALLPAGATDNICELLHPEEAMYREIEEEFVLFHNGKQVDPMEFSVLLTKGRVEIRNEKAPSRNNKTSGELYIKDGRVYLIRAYKINLQLDQVIIYDGEEDPCGNPFDRLVAIVPLDKLNNQVMPVALFKSKKRHNPRLIDLSCYQTDTLEWLRENANRLHKLILS